MYSGVNPRWSGGVYNKFAVDTARALVEGRMAQIKACYVTYQFHAPDHQFVDYRFRVAKDGKIIGFLGNPDGASAERVPALDLCVSRLLVGNNIGKSDDGLDGEIIVGITARRPDNP
jgi:hypothetical protein